jgi:ABC-2 type transport system permease protein
MSTAAVTLEPRLADRSVDSRPSLARLTAVELRKSVDTRAGFWLQLGIVGLMITFAILQAVLGHASDHTLHDILASTLFPSYVFLPIVGILLVSSEWSQRTTLITFTLVPERTRVLVGKLGAGILLAFAAVVLSLALAVVATAFADPGLPRTWSLPGTLLGQELILMVAAMIMGLAYGAVFLSSAPAIVASFALPLAWSALGSISALTGTARWLDSGRSFEPMTDHVMNGSEWARVGTTLAVWMMLPVLIGLWRIARNELS